MDIKFDLIEVMNIQTIHDLMNIFYKETGEKLRISFNGSIGYLSHLEFECGGVQSDPHSRRIFLKRHETLNEDFSINKDISVRIRHSKELGLNVELNSSLNK